MTLLCVVLLPSFRVFHLRNQTDIGTLYEHQGKQHTTKHNNTNTARSCGAAIRPSPGHVLSPLSLWCVPPPRDRDVPRIPQKHPRSERGGGRHDQHMEGKRLGGTGPPIPLYAPPITRRCHPNRTANPDRLWTGRYSQASKPSPLSSVWQSTRVEGSQ